MEEEEIPPPQAQVRVDAHVARKQADIIEKADQAAEGGLKNSECMDMLEPLMHYNSLNSIPHAQRKRSSVR